MSRLSFLRFKGSAIVAPLIVVMILSLMVLPVPAFVLDLLFTLNIALSVVVLLTALTTVKPLDFMAFPAVLLVTTLLRLSLNVASTRIVLTEGHTGSDAAGQVIEAFGHFLIGGDYLVGIVVFVILTLINFMVITKGAGRIAEVGARFALDAMPGKQMAIDADLNAGLIGEADARKRRAEVSQEAEFYGAMDGASKYVKGDAVAGIIITIVNILGGFAVGMLQHGLGFEQAIETYTLLAIGDGLVAQIPSLIVSVAAGAVVSRVASEEDMSAQLQSQLLRNSQTLYITAGILGGLGLIPGMPSMVFLLLGAGLAALAWSVSRSKARAAEALAAAPDASTLAATNATEEASWQDIAPVSAISIEVGYRLVPLVDENQDGELLRRIRSLRKKFAQEVGFLPPAIHVRDNLEIRPTSYRILLKGVEVGSGDSQPGRLMAIDPGMVSGTLEGEQVKDPAFGLPAVWIRGDQRDSAQAMGYTVVDAATVVATHLNHVLLSHASELLGRQEVQALLDHLGQKGLKFGEDLVPKLLPLSTVQKILQNLLAEGVHIRDMATILETLLEAASHSQEASALTASVRIALGRAIVQQLAPESAELPVMALDPRLEKLLLQSMQSSNPEQVTLEPGLAEALSAQAARAAAAQEQMGQTPVLLVPPALRLALSRFLRRGLPHLKVLSHAELPDHRTIRVTQLVGATS